MTSIINHTPTEFEAFGASFISDRAIGEPAHFLIPDELPNARRELRNLCLEQPGIYGWLNQDRQLIYVGKSKSLKHRLLSYFLTTPSDPKMARIRRYATEIVWEPIAHELLALLREQELIHRWQPQYNSQGQPTRRQPAFVCISDSKAPHAFVGKRVPPKFQEIFGPIVGTSNLSESIEALNHVFQLRDCPDKTKFEFGAQLTLFDEPPRAQCIRFELGSCPAPCARVCSPESYRNNVTRALDFLNGNDRETLNRLEEAMTKASLEQNFERAAVIHRQWEALRRLDRQLGRLRRCEQAINGVMSCRVSRSRQLWMVLRGGRLVATFPEPRSKRQAEEAIQSLESARLQPVHSPENILHINLQLIVASWFRKRPEDIDSLQTFEKLIDECKRRVELYSRVA